MKERRDRWSALTPRARATLLDGLALFTVALDAITNSVLWLVAAIAGFLLLRALAFVGRPPREHAGHEHTVSYLRLPDPLDPCQVSRA